MISSSDVQISKRNDIRAVTHAGILEIGQEFEDRFEKHVLGRIETAVFHALELERFECGLRTDFLLRQQAAEHECELQELEACLEAIQRQREKCINEMNLEGREILTKFLTKKFEIAVKKRVQESIRQTRDALCTVFRRKFDTAVAEKCEILKDDIENQLKQEGIHNPKTVWREAHKQEKARMKEELNQKLELESVKHVSDILHLICAQQEYRCRQVVINDSSTESETTDTESCATSNSWMVADKILEQVSDTQWETVSDSSFDEGQCAINALDPEKVVLALTRLALDDSDDEDEETGDKVKSAIKDVLNQLMCGGNLANLIDKALKVIQINGKQNAGEADNTNLIAAKDSFELIHLEHIPELPPIQVSNLVTATDSMEIISKKVSKSVNSFETSKLTRQRPKVKPDKRPFCPHAKVPPYWNIQKCSHLPREPRTLELDDSEILSMFADTDEAEVSQSRRSILKPSEFQLHEVQQENPEEITCKEISRAKKLIKLPLIEVLDLIIDNK